MSLFIKKKQLWPKIFLSVLSLIMLYPVFWWIGASLKANHEMNDPGLFPATPHWENFVNGWHAVSNYSFTRFYINNFILVGSVIIAALLSTSLVAFGFARLSFPLKKLWFALVIVTLMLPYQVQLVPQYTMFHSLGWINTYLPFIVPHLLAGGIGGSFSIFLLVQFIRGIPRELDESAKMDGCHQLGIYWRIILPLMKPSLITVLIYNFLWAWDDFLGQLLYINTADKFTVGLALKMFIDESSNSQWGELIAMSLVSVMPSVILFAVCQRYFVEGISTSGIKG